METSTAAIQIIAFLLAICGSVYLASILWERGNKGSESWKHLSIAMVLFGFWNTIMIFEIMMEALNSQNADGNHEGFKIIIFALRTLDPIVEVMVFIILFFGLMTIIRKMRHKPWVLFNKVEKDE